MEDRTVDGVYARAANTRYRESHISKCEKVNLCASASRTEKQNQCYEGYAGGSASRSGSGNGAATLPVAPSICLQTRRWAASVFHNERPASNAKQITRLREIRNLKAAPSRFEPGNRCIFSYRGSQFRR
jgi:hypothetical protein